MCGDCGREEFTCSALGLTHPRPRIFGESACAVLHFVYVLYRVAAAIYFSIAIIYIGVAAETKEKWFIYLTNWSFFCLALNALMQAGCVISHYNKARKHKQDSPVYEMMPLMFKLGWITQNICLSTAPLVTILYWGILYDDTKEVDGVNIIRHAMNTAYVFIDLLITGVPVRILHFYFTTIFGIIFALFSLVYSLAGGTDEVGRQYIYSQLDWKNSPGGAVAWAAGIAFVAAPLVHLLFWAIYKIEMHILSCCNCGPDALFSTEPTESTAISPGHVNKAYDP